MIFPDTCFFLEDVFPYMEKFHYQKGMKEILRELKQLLKRDHHGTAADQALLLDYQAAMEEKTEKAIRLEKEALMQIKESPQRMPTLSPISMQISEVFTV